MLNPLADDLQITFWARQALGGKVLVNGMAEYLNGFPTDLRAMPPDVRILHVEDGETIPDRTPIATIYTGPIASVIQNQTLMRMMGHFFHHCSREINRAANSRVLAKELMRIYAADGIVWDQAVDFMSWIPDNGHSYRLFWHRTMEPCFSDAMDLEIASYGPELTTDWYLNEFQERGHTARLTGMDPSSALRSFLLERNKYTVLNQYRNTGLTLRIDWDTRSPLSSIPMFVDMLTDAYGYNTDSMGRKMLPDFMKLRPRYIGKDIQAIPRALVELQNRGVSLKGIQPVLRNSILDQKDLVECQWFVSAWHNRKLGNWVGVNSTDYMNGLSTEKGPLMVLRDCGKIVVSQGTDTGIMVPFEEMGHVDRDAIRGRARWS